MRYNRKFRQNNEVNSHQSAEPVIVSSIDDESTMIEWERQMRDKWGFDQDILDSFKAVRSQQAYVKYCADLGIANPPGA